MPKTNPSNLHKGDLQKEAIIEQFDPNAPGTGTLLFGLPFGLEHSAIVVLPAPWEVTVSYRSGTAKGPSAILDASFQVDLYDPLMPDLWKIGIWMAPISDKWRKTSKRLRKYAKDYIGWLLDGSPASEAKAYLKMLEEINTTHHSFNEWVQAQCHEYMAQGKVVVLLGGDHSTPLGYLQALASRYASFGILHLDAHADLRKAYEGFEYSHASIMYHALQISQVEKIVSVGIRDICEDEAKLAAKSGHRVTLFSDQSLKEGHYEGKTWKQQTDEILLHLPQQVYVSIDIDCLDPKLCPNTGTPVPGGLAFEQVTYLLQKLAESGRTIIGADLVEVSPGDDEWDATVGARMLYKTAGSIAFANKLS
jgi:agmatinase